MTYLIRRSVFTENNKAKLPCWNFNKGVLLLYFRLDNIIPK